MISPITPIVRAPATMMSARANSCAMKIHCPSPDVAPTSSAAITARQPKPSPERRPDITWGSAPGKVTFRKMCSLDAPSVCKLRSSTSGTIP